jgi:hypothetical protein
MALAGFMDRVFALKGGGLVERSTTEPGLELA